MIHVAFTNTYASELAELGVVWQPAHVPSPRWLRFNNVLAAELGLPVEALRGDAGADFFSGNQLPPGASPFAQVYAGHQFGGFSPRLGDGRALLLGEIIDRAGQRRDIAMKGSGPTPFSRGGDGKAAVGPVLREYIIGEALHALGVPTTRALAAVATGETIYRTAGQPGAVPGAVLTRVAASHLRVGTFEYLAARNDHAMLARLVDYAFARHVDQSPSEPLATVALRARALLCHVIARQAELIAAWMCIGFVHGVMNTDNMTISGEAIDFGPCAFLDAYDVGAVFSSIDTQGRYAFGNQPRVALWNLTRFAEALLPLLADEEPAAIAFATEELGHFDSLFEAAWLRGMRQKMGLTTAHADDAALARDYLDLLQRHQADYTNGFRALGELAENADGSVSAWQAMFATDAQTTSRRSEPSAKANTTSWLVRYHARIAQEPTRSAVAAQLRATNPLYIARNHLVEAALTAATAGDLQPFETLLAAISAPFAERPDSRHLTHPAPADFTATYQTFCGT